MNIKPDLAEVVGTSIQIREVVNRDGVPTYHRRVIDSRDRGSRLPDGRRIYLADETPLTQALVAAFPHDDSPLTDGKHTRYFVRVMESDPGLIRYDEETLVVENGEVVARERGKKHLLYAIQDIADLPADVQRACNAVWTDEVKAAEAAKWEQETVEVPVMEDYTDEDGEKKQREKVEIVDEEVEEDDVEIKNGKAIKRKVTRTKHREKPVTQSVKLYESDGVTPVMRRKE